MRGSSLYSLLVQMNKKALSRFKKFLKSPYFNVNMEAVQLIEYFNSEIKKGEKGRLLKKDVYTILFNDKYKDQKLRLLYSEVLGLLKEFLTLEQSKKSDYDSIMKLAESYYSMGKNELYFKTLTKHLNHLSKTPHKDSQYYLEVYNLQKLIYRHVTKYNRTKEQNLDEVTSNFDIYFFIEKLRHGCIYIAQNHLFKNDVDNESLRFTIKSIRKNIKILNNNPVLEVYFYCYLALLNPLSKNEFEKFKISFYKHISNFQKEEARELFIFAMNLCAKKINLGEKEYIKVAFELYKYGIEKEYLIINNIISQYSFKNTVSLAIKVGEHDWASNFIEKYSDLLPPSQKMAVSKISLAKLKDALGLKEEAIHLLKNFHSDDPLWTLAANLNLIKIYFEEEDFDSLGFLLEKMNMYAIRKKATGYHKSNFKHVIKITKKLISLPPYGNDEREKLMETIEQSKTPLLEKKWFLQQIKKGLTKTVSP